MGQGKPRGGAQKSNYVEEMYDYRIKMIMGLIVIISYHYHHHSYLRQYSFPNIGGDYELLFIDLYFYFLIFLYFMIDFIRDFNFVPTKHFI